MTPVSRGERPISGRFSAAATRPQALAQDIQFRRSTRILSALTQGLKARGITQKKGGLNEVAKQPMRTTANINPKTKNSRNLVQRFREF